MLRILVHNTNYINNAYQLLLVLTKNDNKEFGYIEPLTFSIQCSLSQGWHRMPLKGLSCGLGAGRLIEINSTSIVV